MQNQKDSSNSKMKISKSGLFFCKREHKDASQRIGGVKEIMPPHYGKGNKLYTCRKKLLKKHGKCNRCGYDENIAAIIVHHKDRDRTNNTKENLEILCANCHYIEHY